MRLKQLPIGPWYIGFGLFLILCGILGFASNPSEAKTALISGGTFGSLSAGLGFWMWKKTSKLPRIAAACITLLLCGAFSWRATVSWQALGAGEPKLFTAVLISSMLVASLLSGWKLWRNLRETTA